MSAVTAVNLYPISQLFTDLIAVLPDCFKASDQCFRRVIVNKLDEHGSVKGYNVQDEVTGVYEWKTELKYIEDIKTGEFYLDKPWHILSTLGLGIALVDLPVYTVGVMAWNVYITSSKVVEATGRMIRDMGKEIALGRFYQASLVYDKETTHISTAFKNGLWGCATAPLFGLMLEGAGIITIFRPYQGRKIEAIIEKAWRQGMSYKADIRKIKKRDGEDDCQACWKDAHTAQAFYLAYCFQPRGKVTDPRIRVLRREAL